MYVTFGDLLEVFPNVKGIQDETLSFHTVSAFAKRNQPKGIFIPLWNDSGELQQAIQNGAIAAIWEEQKAIPSYTPNHFPVFFTTDLAKGFINMLKVYKDQTLFTNDSHEEVTKFDIFHDQLLNELIETYDISVIEEKLTQEQSNERRE